MPAPSIARSSLIMAAGTLASRVLGLVRNALLVAALGATASGAADAFNVANMLPTQLYNLIIGGVLNAILVPQIVRALRQRHGEELVNRLLTAAGAVIAAVTALLTVAAPLVITVYASGLGRWQPLAYAFAFWCMPQVFFYGLYALWGQVLNARHSFGPYMWSPVINNLVSIASVVAYLHMYGSYTAGQAPAAWDGARITLIGGCATAGIALQALILYVPLVRSGFRPRLVWGVRGLGLGTVSRVAMWALLATAITALGDLAITNLGSMAVTAAEAPQYADVVVPSATMYANALMVYMLPQSLVTTSVVTALFTRMSEKAAADDAAGVREDLSLGLRTVGVFTVLFGAGIATLAGPALQLFVPSLTQAQATASAPVLAVLALGIPFQGLMFTMQRVLLAYADTRRLVPVNLVGGSVMILSCVIARLAAPATWWMTIAAMGNALGLVAVSAVMVPVLRRRLGHLDGRRVAGTYGRLVVAAGCAAGVGWLLRWLLGPADGSLSGVRALDAGVMVLLVAVVMTAVYLVVGSRLGVAELAVAVRPVARIARRCGVPLPQWLIGEAPRPVAATSEGVGRLDSSHVTPTGGRRMGQATPIGSGRYELDSPLPATLPRIVRHSGRDTVLDRPVTVLTLTDAVTHRQAVLEAAARAALVADPHVQRVYDVETGTPSYVITEPAAPMTLLDAVAHGLSPAQARAVVGQLAEVLSLASEQDLYHLNLRPESVRLRRDGTVQLLGLGIEAAAHGQDGTVDPLGSRATDAHALACVAYFALTGRWPGKTAGLPAAPVADGRPVVPSRLRTDMTAQDADLDELITRTWGEDPLPAARDVAALLRSWDARCLEPLAALAPVRPSAQGQAGAASQETGGPASADAAVTAGSAVAAAPVAGGLAASAGGIARQAASAVGGAAQAGAAAAGPLVHRAGQAVGRAAGGVAALWSGLRTRLSTAREAEAEATGLAATAERARPALASDQDTTPPPPAPAAGAASPAAVTEQVSAPSSTITRRSVRTLPAASSADAPRSNRAVSRTTAIVLVVAAAAVVVGMMAAVSNLLELTKFQIADEDLPAAQTVPTTQPPSQEEQTSSQGEGAGETGSADATAVITVTGASSLDPEGGTPDHPELAGALVDGDPATGWYSRYYASASLSPRQGIGVAVQLAQAAEVSGIDMAGTGTGGHFQIRATSAQDPQGGTVLAEGEFSADMTSVDFPAHSTGSVVVWVTQLPTASDGKFKITIGEITLR